MISQLSGTRFEKALKKTIALKNFAYQFYKKNDLILSNNRNISYGDVTKPKIKLEGA